MTLSIAGAADLLLQWWPQLRACERCGALFLPQHGHQRFHDMRCNDMTRCEKFRQKPKSPKEADAELRTRGTNASPAGTDREGGQSPVRRENALTS
jgi:hypothetical protein